MNISKSDVKHKHYHLLDGMRGVAAIAVMFVHYTQHTPVEVFNNAGLAVDFFFMLSGFVLVASYGEKMGRQMSVANYLLRRLIRLYPYFILGLVLGVGSLLWLMKAGFAHLSLRDLFTGFGYNAVVVPYFNLNAIQNFDAEAAIVGEIFPANPPLWSLFFEMIASLVFVGMIKLSRAALWRMVIVSFGLLFMCGFAVSWAHGHYGPDLGIGWGQENFFGGYPRVMYGFSVGVLIYRLLADGVTMPFQIAQSWRRPWLIYLLMLTVFAVPTVFKGIYPFIILIGVAPMMVMTAARITEITATERRIADWLGWISYPVYCLHFPIGRAVFLAGSLWHLPTFISALVAVAVTMVCATVLTKMYEEPLREYLTRHLLNPSN